MSSTLRTAARAICASSSAAARTVLPAGRRAQSIRLGHAAQTYRDRGHREQSAPGPHSTKLRRAASRFPRTEGSRPVGPVRPRDRLRNCAPDTCLAAHSRRKMATDIQFSVDGANWVTAARGRRSVRGGCWTSREAAGRFVRVSVPGKNQRQSRMPRSMVRHFKGRNENNRKKGRTCLWYPVIPLKNLAPV